MTDLPYSVEYAKSSRASCKLCKNTIDQGTLRIALMVQSPFFDGKQPNWHHLDCLFSKKPPTDISEIANFNKIKHEDQEAIKKKISGISFSPFFDGKQPNWHHLDCLFSKKPPTAISEIANFNKIKHEDQEAIKKKISGEDKGTKRGKNKKNGAMPYTVEYSKSSRATCRHCDIKICKDEIRVAKIDYDPKYGDHPLWHHVKCFAEKKVELNFLGGGEELPGFKSLKKEDQNIVKQEIRSSEGDEVPIKKIKKEPKDEEDVKAEAELKKQLVKQSKLYDKSKDALSQFTKNELHELLQANDQDVLTGRDENLQFFLLGKFKSSKEEVKNRILKLGGLVVSKITDTTAAAVSSKNEVKKMSAKMEELREKDIEVVEETFLDLIDPKEGTISDTLRLIRENNIADWGTDPSKRIPQDVLDGKSIQKSGSQYVKSKSGITKLKVKGGTAVDPDSGLEDVAHVYKDGDGTKYTVVLSKTDVVEQKNSYYKLQVLEADNKKKYWLFRSWGRIGTPIGGNKVENCSSLLDAINKFEGLYMERTQNPWDARDHFMKMPGAYFPIDMDYGDEQTSAALEVDTVKCKLPVPVQKLIMHIFDINIMKQTLMEFELDTDKMPLGKLSKKQIKSGYNVLSELLKYLNEGKANENKIVDATNRPETTVQSLDTDKMPLGKLSKMQIKSGYNVLSELLKYLNEGKANENKIVDATNRFYTLVPHNFGTDNPPLLNNAEVIKSKTEMLDNLLEIEIAYNLLKSEDDDDKSVSPIETHYIKLKTEISPLDVKSPEYELILEYMRNTHAETHSSYTLDIESAFKVIRDGEEKRFKPFKKLHNRRLLWHGSRVTNFAGILSQGLRIAPPEAPVTGYMFGKGIYFADMVSKSANYCCTNKANPLGIIMLCEVALGDMKKCHQAEYITKLPSGKHSTWGVGRTQPDPARARTLPDGTLVPLGPPVSAEQNTALLYNEFIVYDVAQVKAKYVLQVKFNYKF
ncbi:Poly [ADP-ribose] polymerase [Papilio machaon]|uniref:Poly [ADP-ribose] polymerase n=1 Tax=Papilio machaon TaxID=76193 RepID=A0A194R5X7_PAPMA|nr:Poly [ADP-ribose] polymerase [Papilio machaon]